MHLTNEHHNIDDNTEDLQPLPFSSKNPSWDPKDLQTMLNYISPDHSLYTKNGAEEEVSTCIVNEANNVPFHDVVRAEFSHSPNDELCSQISQRQRIYNLGLVFYELFSVGERPQEINTRSDTAVSMHKHGVDEGDAVEEPLTLGKLSIFDDIDDVENIFKYSEDGSQLLDVTEVNLIPQKKRSNRSSCMLSSNSTEPLRQKGVPISLCNHQKRYYAPFMGYKFIAYLCP